MEEKLEFEWLFENLRENPDQLWISPTGEHVVFMANEEKDLFGCVKASHGMDFNQLSQEELEAHVLNSMNETQRKA